MSYLSEHASASDRTKYGVVSFNINMQTVWFMTSFIVLFW
uniref:Uncharacterized protein n=1 Tax=Arundo donax TaxID=35708 RepID=A0A0A9AVK1_ARUDO